MGFYIGEYFIAYYGLMIAMGILAASLLGWHQCRRHGLCFDDFILLALCVGVMGFLGAKTLYLLVSLPLIDVARLGDFDYLKELVSGGFVFYGGFLGGLVGLVLAKALFKIDIKSFVAFCMPCIPLTHAFGRIGCSLAGCCYGMPYDGLGAITYTASLAAPLGEPLFPVQAVEALCEFIIAAILLLWINRRASALEPSALSPECIDKTGTAKTSDSRESNKHIVEALGFKPLLGYVLLYAPVRFLLEFARYDFVERGAFGVLSTSQWISLVLFVVAVALLCSRRKPTVI